LCKILGRAGSARSGGNDSGHHNLRSIMRVRRGS
jgi:hypothetical protein